MDYKILLHENIIKQDLSLFVDIIYNNFIELNENPKLMHNKEKILESLQSQNAVLIIAMNKKTMAGFVMGEIIELQDRRQVLFISYIYVAQSMRSNGLGGELMTIAENFALNNKSMYDTKFK